MLIFQAIILGIVQAITEFVPVSSSGHLIIFHEFWTNKMLDSVAFDVALHLGTVLALLIYFRQDLISIVVKFFNFKNDSWEKRLGWQILIGIVPAVIVGMIAGDYIENALRSPLIIGIALIIGGLLFFLVEKFCAKQTDLTQLTFKNALLIGLAQCLAFIPGVSRSGITIITGLGLNLKREAAAKFSFLLGIPVLLGAGVKQLFFSDITFIATEKQLFVLGFFVSFLAGYLVIKYFLQYLKSHSLNAFGVYRIILGIIVIIYFTLT